MYLLIVRSISFHLILIIFTTMYIDKFVKLLLKDL